jgi:alpha-1,2-mannosyltransferase
MVVQRKSDPLWAVVQYIVSPILSVSYISFHIGLILTFILFFTAFFSILILKLKFRISRTKKSEDQKVIAFFHPYCDAGGGGERVLWCGIRAIQRRFPAEKIVIFTGDINSAPDQIISKAQQRFNIEIDTENLEFIYLHRRKWIEAETYPRFTLLGQSLGSMWLALEALEKCCPDVFLDTMGYAFALPIFKYFGNCKGLKLHIQQSFQLILV